MSARVDRVYNQIRELIAKGYGPGHRLPSERSLADMCDVSFTIVRQALGRLREEKRVTTQSGRGTFVADLPSRERARRKVNTIGVLLTGSSPVGGSGSGFDEILFRTIEKELSQNDIALRYIENPSEPPRITREDLRPPVEQIPWNEIDGLLIYSVFDTEVFDHPRLKAGPVLVVDQDATRYGLHSVGFDDRQAGVLAARHLLDLGHTRFGVVEEAVYGGRGYDKAWTDRRFGFEETVLMHAAFIQPEWRMTQSRFGGVRGAEPSWLVGFKRILEIPADERPTAVFMPSIDIMRSMHEYLNEVGLGVPRNFSLATVASPFEGPPPEPWSVDSHPTVVVCDPASMGVRAAETITDLVAGWPDDASLPRFHPVAVTLHKGRTTARPVEPDHT